MSQLCIPFGELGVTAQSAGVFGAFAERKITDRYLKDVGRFKGGGQTNFFPFNVFDFNDPAKIWSRTGLLGEFIMTHNPGKVTEGEWKALQFIKGALAVPDIMTHDSARKDFEFYEVKPASWSGLPAGIAKQALLVKLFKDHDLPYTAGLTWWVDDEEYLTEGNVLGTRIRFYLHYYRGGPGLVWYEICMKGNFAEVLAKVGYVAFIAACVYVLLLMLPGLLGGAVLV